MITSRQNRIGRTKKRTVFFFYCRTDRSDVRNDIKLTFCHSRKDLEYYCGKYNANPRKDKIKDDEKGFLSHNLGDKAHHDYGLRTASRKRQRNSLAIRVLQNLLFQKPKEPVLRCKTGSFGLRNNGSHLSTK